MAEKLTAMGTPETDRNIANKISRGGFTAAFLLSACCDWRSNIAVGRRLAGAALAVFVVALSLIPTAAHLPAQGERAGQR